MRAAAGRLDPAADRLAAAAADWFSVVVWVLQVLSSGHHPARLGAGQSGEDCLAAGSPAAGAVAEHRSQARRA